MRYILKGWGIFTLNVFNVKSISRCRSAFLSHYKVVRSSSSRCVSWCATLHKNTNGRDEMHWFQAANRFELERVQWNLKANVRFLFIDRCKLLPNWSNNISEKTWTSSSRLENGTGAWSKMQHISAIFKNHQRHQLNNVDTAQ